METQIQRAREIAAQVYREDSQETPPHRSPDEWRAHVEAFTTYMLEGHYDHIREVKTALAAIQSCEAA